MVTYILSRALNPLIALITNELFTIVYFHWKLFKRLMDISAEKEDTSKMFCTVNSDNTHVYQNYFIIYIHHNTYLNVLQRNDGGVIKIFSKKVLPRERWFHSKTSSQRWRVYIFTQIRFIYLFFLYENPQECTYAM